MLSSKIRERKEVLNKLWYAIEAYESEILEALFKDLGKPEAEALLHEIYPLKKEIQFAINNLRLWMGKRFVGTPFSMIGTRHYVKAEPKGQVLIISPWNFPVMLTLRPLIGALAAGNSVVVKPSEHTPHTSDVLKKLLGSVFDDDLVKVELGGPKVAASLTASPFNHICFTGGTNIGRLVMSAAAEHLCSITLELGGKSPVIVDKSANLKNLAIKVAWGKYLNAGQVCIAPDHLLVEDSIETAVVEKISGRITEMFGTNPIDSPDLGKIVNLNHFERILKLIKDAVKDGAKLHVPGGVLESGPDIGKISPCILTGCTNEMAIMKEEVFGPVLPVMTWKRKEEIVEIIDKNPHPLALYIFSKDKFLKRWFVDNTKAGTTAINEVVIQVANPDLPFGGIQTSGIGRSAGKASFDSFSNLRSFVVQISTLSALHLTFPPFKGRGLFISRLVRKWL
ncbi:MAG: aldehyde dehydrogenase family protein [Bacteroidetes bacterium]|nr:MAG: aldehyde dehydrogenase family protein [Bacteroidota bacterium]